MIHNGLGLNWAYGFSKDTINGVQSLCCNNRNAFLSLTAHSAVIYDFENRAQTILQGHCNIISCCVIDKTKRWIVTADSGFDPIMIVWDAITCVPVKTFSCPHESGVGAIDISDDAVFLVTLSAKDTNRDLEQQVAVWAWTTDDSDAVLRQIVASNDPHTSVKFNPQNKTQFVTSGQHTVCFWNWNEYSLDSYYGTISRSDLGNYSGIFTCSIFLPGTDNALTASSDGYVILWEGHSENNAEQQDNTMKKATKVLRLVDCGINLMLTTSNDYLVLGCADGAVRFYDYFLRLEAWFEDLGAGPVTSLSFSEQFCPYSSGEAGAPGLKFWVPDFIVGTSNAFVVGVESSLFDEVRKDDRRGTLLLQGMSDDVKGIATHPFHPLVAILCGNGVLQVWNYELKLLMIMREFSPSLDAGRSDDRKSTPGRSRNALSSARCLCFDSSGSFLAVGFGSGVVKLLNGSSLVDVSTFAPSSDSVDFLRFSESGNFLAGYDSGNHVLLFAREVTEAPTHVVDENAEVGTRVFERRDVDRHYDALSYVYVGRARAHTAPVVSVQFGVRDMVETLISVGQDRYCVEFDLAASSVSAGLQCVKQVVADDVVVMANRLELTALPTAVMWHPRLNDDAEDRFVVANDEFKLKEFNLDSKQCRKTTLAPRFGNPPVVLLPIQSAVTAPLSASSSASLVEHFCFATSSRVIGIGSFPLTGDPSATVGIVAHPGEITALAVSYDGKYVFSAGGSDLSVNMWRVTIESASKDSAVNYGSLSGEEGVVIRGGVEPLSEGRMSALAPYFSLMEGGEGGELHRDIIDYFYFCQLRNLGENSMEQRNLTGVIPLEEIPSLVRSVGFYPSEEEVANMINEIKYKRFMNTGETQDFIGLDEMIKLYLNHRPVMPLDRLLVSVAFDRISGSINEGSSSEVRWKELRDCLCSEGEKISADDLECYLMALTGGGVSSIADSSSFDAASFAQHLLGFEDFNNSF